MTSDKPENIKTTPPVETDIKIVGDGKTICQLVQLLAYIRNAIESDIPKKITLNIGSNVKPDHGLAFTVNNEQIREYIAKDYLEIN